MKQVYGAHAMLGGFVLPLFLFQTGGACYVMRCNGSEIEYDTGETSRKPILTYWQVCPEEGIATNLVTKMTYRVKIEANGIDFIDMPGSSSSHALKPRRVIYNKCKATN